MWTLRNVKLRRELAKQSLQENDQQLCKSVLRLETPKEGGPYQCKTEIMWKHTSHGKVAQRKLKWQM